MQKATDLDERADLDGDDAGEALFEVVLGKVGGLCDCLKGDVRFSDRGRDGGGDLGSSCHKGNITLP